MKVSWVVLWATISALGFVGCASDQQQQGQQEELEQGEQGEGEDGYAENQEEGFDDATDVNQFNELGDGGLNDLANSSVNEVGLDQATNDGGEFNNAATAGASNLDPASRVVRYAVSDGTSVYSQPSADGTPVTTLEAGDVVLVSLMGDGWAQIDEGRYVSEGSLSEQIVPRTPSGEQWTDTPPAPPAPAAMDANAAPMQDAGDNPFNQGDDLGGDNLGNEGYENQAANQGDGSFGNSQQLDQSELNNQTENNLQEDQQNDQDQENNEDYQQENENYDE